MAEYQLIKALNKYVVLEGIEQNTILKTEDTVYKVVSVGNTENSWLHTNQLVIVDFRGILKTVMGNKVVTYILEDDIVALVK